MKENIRNRGDEEIGVLPELVQLCRKKIKIIIIISSSRILHTTIMTRRKGKVGIFNVCFHFHGSKYRSYYK